ncbi:Zn-ribbon domain-containing OB-fold protein [Amycolatopsis sp. GM8]|uniref:Zn-ribbon domain-containing OB-fold protein n=1 Tax=Amycolatopsis sp. GM8 TaxID=2896530 RepID=UPI001F4090FA|nr:Zn-ribbon domain-containing OB-fold protein [Amycolatopsis sp. GM8]
MSAPADFTRPLPRPTALSEPFWAGCREGKLLVQQCANCRAHVFIPREFCPFCHGETLEWVVGSGCGTVVTYTAVWRAQTPAFEVPYVVAVVRLAEGYEMLTNIVGVPPEEVRIGAAVRVHFVPVTTEITLPCFRLDPDAEDAQ